MANSDSGGGDGSFISCSVRIVDFDSANKNFLVRGSAAFGASGFELSDLITAITNDPNYVGTGLTLGSTPGVVDFCLIGYGVESKDAEIVATELSWFTSSPPTLNGTSGPYPTYIPSTSTSNTDQIMVYWPVQAIGGTAPTNKGGTWPVSPANSIGSGTSQFDFAGLIPAIWNALTNNISALPQPWTGPNPIQSSIVYVHCDSGVNRTGAAVVGYLMCNGSNVSALSLAPAPSSVYALQQAQNAANLAAPPGNDASPLGGTDIPVAEAYCNFLATGHLDHSLAPNCVPLSS